MTNPFPDNHNGFDYAPQSESDIHAEYQNEVSQANQSRQQDKLMGMLASIFK